MPATMTAEYDNTGLTGSALYDKVKAALVATNVVIHDEYVSSSLYTLVERISVPGSPDIYGRWMINNSFIYAPQLYTGWNATSHVGSGPLGPQPTTSTPPAYMRGYASAGGYRFLLLTTGSSNNYALMCFGWVAPATAPSGWNTAGLPFVGTIATINGPNPLNNVTFPTLAAGQGSASTSLALPLLDGVSITRFPPFVGLDWGTYEVPTDFAVITGRTTSDAATNRDTTYTVTVAGEARTYQLLSLSTTANAAMCVRTA